MTTIAYKDKVIAYDGRVTQGRVIVQDDSDKKVKKGGKVFFFSGSVRDYDHLISCYLGEQEPEDDEEGECEALVVDEGKVYRAYIVDGNLCVEEQPLERSYAIGSGSPYALTAMDMGADAAKAVKMASLRDIYTGGKIWRYRIK